MAVNNEFLKPETEQAFEAMCHQLYGRVWQDVECARVGRSGQGQFGVDVLGIYGGKRIGVQCKHYVSTKFTLKTVTNDISKVESTGLAIGHLKFATTAPSDSGVVKDVQELSEQRRLEGRFTVSVDFWPDICGHIQVHPEVGRAFIPQFPGSILLEIAETTAATHATVNEMSKASSNNHAELVALLKEAASPIALSKSQFSADAKGDEADPVVVATLDLVRDKLREGKTQDARELLAKLGDPSELRDQFSQFRWHTNVASIELEEGNTLLAIEGFLTAYDFAPDNEKAIANRAHALLLSRENQAATEACEEGLKKYPESPYLWALLLHARHECGLDGVEADIPENLRDASDLLFARARLAGKRGDLGSATALLRQCLVKDGGSFEARRSLLVEALTWATQDSVHAGHLHLSQEQVACLTESVESFEPLEQTLATIQSGSTSLELSGNVAIALWLLGDISRANTIASIFLSRHPHSEALLRIRISQLEQGQDVEAIRALTDERLLDLPLSILALLAEIAAGEGDNKWFQAIYSHIEALEHDKKKLLDLHALSFQALWSSGDQDGALEAIKSHLLMSPHHVLARAMLAQFLWAKGEKNAAVTEAVSCADLIDEHSSAYDVMQAADQLLRVREYALAAPLYRRLVIHPGADELTKHLLICLVESDQRRQAQKLLEQMPPSARDAPVIRRLECNLARRMADWPRLRDLLTIEREHAPSSAAVGVAYAGALYRADDHPELRTYLESDPNFSNTSPEEEFEFAKHQIGLGLHELAIRRLYRLYRRNSDSTKAAGYFLSQLLLSPPLPSLSPPASVIEGSAVLLQGLADKWWVALDSAPKMLGGWPELVSSSSALAKQLLGRKCGDSVQVDRGVVSEQVEILEIKSIFAFAADKAHERIRTSVSADGPIWSFQAFKDDGSLNLDAMLEVARERRQRVDLAFSLYQEHRLPISSLIDLLGTDIVNLMLDWPYASTSFFVGVGTHSEREDSTSQIEAGSKRYVFDLVALVELTRNNAFEEALKTVGTPIVPRSVQDEVVNIIHMMEKQRPVGTLGEDEGHLSGSVISAESLAAREAFVRELLSNVERCEVSATVGPEIINDELRGANHLLDTQTIDSLYLCIEHDAVLVTEDGGLRLLASSLGVKVSMCTQPILLVAQERGILSGAKYAGIIASKISSNHDFVSVRAEDLLELAKRSGSGISSDVVSALETFRRSSTDIISAVQVATTFLRFAAAQFPPRIVGTYSKLVSSVLTANRSALVPHIQKAISAVLQQQYGRNGRKLSPTERRHFHGLLARNLTT